MSSPTPWGKEEILTDEHQGHHVQKKRDFSGLWADVTAYRWRTWGSGEGTQEPPPTPQPPLQMRGSCGGRELGSFASA